MKDATYWHNRNFIAQHSDQVVICPIKKEHFDATDDIEYKAVLLAGSWKIEDGFKSVVVLQDGKLKFKNAGRV